MVVIDIASTVVLSHFILIMFLPSYYYYLYILKWAGYNVSLLYKAILCVRGLFAPTGHSFQDTDIWLVLLDPNIREQELLDFLFTTEASLIN